MAFLLRNLACSPIHNTHQWSGPIWCSGHTCPSHAGQMLPKLGLLQATHGKCAGTSLTSLFAFVPAGLREDFGALSSMLPTGIELEGGSERGAAERRGRNERGTSSRRGATTSISG